MKFRVVLTHKSERDIESVLQWFGEQSAAATGTRWFTQLMARIAELELLPHRSPLAAEAAEIGIDIRELLFGRRSGRYRLLFRIEGRSVVVLRVWHGARDAVSRDDL